MLILSFGGQYSAILCFRDKLFSISPSMWLRSFHISLVQSRRLGPESDDPGGWTSRDPVGCRWFDDEYSICRMPIYRVRPRAGIRGGAAGSCPRMAEPNLDSALNSSQHFAVPPVYVV